MSCILNIETSTPVCSVALSFDGQLVFNRENRENVSHSSLLGTYVLDAVEYARKNERKIDAVAVSSGPGSYTGLRIGISEVKGLCYGWEVPLIAIPTLKILANGIITSGYAADYYCPMIDARRMEVYSALYDGQLQEIREVRAEIIDESSFAKDFLMKKVAFFGNGSEKCRTIIQSSNAFFVPDIVPLAHSMIALSEKAYTEKRFEDVAYFEPFYLKEFVAIKAKNKVLKNEEAKS